MERVAGGEGLYGPIAVVELASEIHLHSLSFKPVFRLSIAISNPEKRMTLDSSEWRLGNPEAAIFHLHYTTLDWPASLRNS